jgi:alkylation response protein AidB-like acyl-CoA dehydrogenase
MKEIEKEREMIREVAVKTAQRVVKPKAAEMDETGECPRELLDTLGRQGLLSVLLPEEFGGTHGDIFSFCLVIEEIAKVCGSSSLILLAQGAGAMPILIGGDASQQERYFNQIAEKNSLTALAMGDVDVAAGVGPIEVEAQKQGGDYLLRGRKGFVTNGSVADLYSVFTGLNIGSGEKDFSVFVVEKGTPGLRFGKREETIGMRGAVITEVLFEDCRVPQGNRLGGDEKGREIPRKTLNIVRTGVGAQAIGLAQGALDFATNYSHERVQFGKPISSFQALRFMVADMATLVEAARALVYKSATSEETSLDELERLSAVAKCYATDAAMKVTTDAVQILGGYGYMRDYPLERMMRDAKVTQVYGGSNQVQRLVIAHHLFHD